MKKSKILFSNRTSKGKVSLKIEKIDTSPDTILVYLSYLMKSNILLLIHSIHNSIWRREDPEKQQRMNSLVTIVNDN